MISKTHFIEVIEALQQQHLEDKKNADVVGMMFNTDGLNLYDNSLLQKAIIGMLRMWFPVDDEGYCELTDYCFVLDFGKRQVYNLTDQVYETQYESPAELYDRLVNTKN